MTDAEIDVIVGQIDEMAQRIGCRFVPDPDKLLAFRCSHRELEATKKHFAQEFDKIRRGQC